MTVSEDKIQPSQSSYRKRKKERSHLSENIVSENWKKKPQKDDDSHSNTAGSLEQQPSS